MKYNSSRSHSSAKNNKQKLPLHQVMIINPEKFEGVPGQFKEQLSQYQHQIQKQKQYNQYDFPLYNQEYKENGGKKYEKQLDFNDNKSVTSNISNKFLKFPQRIHKRIVIKRRFTKNQNITLMNNEQDNANSKNKNLSSNIDIKNESIAQLFSDQKNHSLFKIVDSEITSNNKNFLECPSNERKSMQQSILRKKYKNKEKNSQISKNSSELLQEYSNKLLTRIYKDEKYLQASDDKLKNQNVKQYTWQTVQQPNLFGIIPFAQGEKIKLQNNQPFGKWSYDSILSQRKIFEKLEKEQSKQQLIDNNSKRKKQKFSQNWQQQIDKQREYMKFYTPEKVKEIESQYQDILENQLNENNKKLDEEHKEGTQQQPLHKEVRKIGLKNLEKSLKDILVQNSQIGNQNEQLWQSKQFINFFEENLDNLISKNPQYFQHLLGECKCYITDKKYRCGGEDQSIFKKSFQNLISLYNEQYRQPIQKQINDIYHEQSQFKSQLNFKAPDQLITQSLNKDSYQIHKIHNNYIKENIIPQDNLTLQYPLLNQTSSYNFYHNNKGIGAIFDGKAVSQALNTTIIPELKFMGTTSYNRFFSRQHQLYNPPISLIQQPELKSTLDNKDLQMQKETESMRTYTKPQIENYKNERYKEKIPLIFPSNLYQFKTKSDEVNKQMQEFISSQDFIQCKSDLELEQNIFEKEKLQQKFIDEIKQKIKQKFLPNFL